MDRENLTLTTIESNIAKSAEMRHKTNICASINAFIFYIYADIHTTYSNYQYREILVV